MAVHKSVLAFVCLCCISHGHRLQKTNVDAEAQQQSKTIDFIDSSQSFAEVGQEGSRVNANSTAAPLSKLALLLLAGSPVAAFRPVSGLRSARSSSTNAHPMGSHRWNQQRAQVPAMSLNTNAGQSSNMRNSNQWWTRNRQRSPVLTMSAKDDSVFDGSEAGGPPAFDPSDFDPSFGAEVPSDVDMLLDPSDADPLMSAKDDSVFDGADAPAFEPSGFDPSFGAQVPSDVTPDEVAQREVVTSIDAEVTEQEAAAAAAAPRELVAFKNLQAREFQHPQDKENTQRLSQLVPIEFTLRRLLLPLLEEAGFLENIGRGVQVSAAQAPTINRLAVEAAAQLDMPVPDVFIRQDPRPNAYTLAIQGKRPFVVLTTSLIDLMTLEEIKAVIGHELGHLKCEHSLWITVLNTLALGIDVIELLFPLGLRDLVERQLTQWRRSAELSCDRASLLVAQDESVVMSTLMKLTGGSLKLTGELSAEEFALQAETYENTAQSSALGRIILRQDQNQLYPLPILRAREIQKYAKSKEYQDLKKKRATTIRFKSG